VTKLYGIETGHRDKVVELLQTTLANLIDLALMGKQAHWNLRGPQFRAIHLQLDEVVNDVRLHSDEVAERIVTLGVSADGRSQTIAKSSTLEPFPKGHIPALEAAKELADRIDHSVRALRQGLGQLGELDPVSEDLAIAVAGSLEKHQWMLRSLIEG
jgi:starvation-inducible DNA-binding protein